MHSSTYTKNIYSCCSYLETKCLHVMGIFRVAVKTSDIMSLKEEIEGSPPGEHWRIFECCSPHVVAGLTTTYLRELPVPLIPLHLVEFPKNHEKVDRHGYITLLKRLRDDLPPSSFNLLEYIIKFFIKVTHKSKQNEMTAELLAQVLGPVICRPERGSFMSVNHMANLKYIRDMIQTLLEHPETILAYKQKPVPSTTHTLHLHYNQPHSYMDYTSHEASIIDSLIRLEVDDFFDTMGGTRRPEPIRENEEEPQLMSSRRDDDLVMQDIEYNVNRGNLDALEEKNDPWPHETDNNDADEEEDEDDGDAGGNLDEDDDTVLETKHSHQHTPTISSSKTTKSSRPGSPSTLSMLPLPELRTLKKSVKEKLVAYDNEFKRKNGRMPTKSEKEPIRHLYVKYNEIKTLLQKKTEESTATFTSTITSASGSKGQDTKGGVKTSTKTLLAEKRALQAKLREYERKFEFEKGRKVKYHRDISPVESDYQRYKVLKSMLRQAGYVSSKQKV